MSVFQHDDFDGHEQVAFFKDDDTGLRAIIAVHNTNLGPALGGVRMWPYASDQEALRDVLRLSRGMTYKSALAGLAFGGGKSVIIGDPRKDKSEALMRAMGRSVEKLAGRYIAAEDSGTSVEDIRQMGTQTEHVVGIANKCTRNGEARSGDPSPVTARGVFVGLEAAVRHRLGRGDLDGTKVAVQGVGNVGQRLVEYLRDAGARCWVTDIHAERVAQVADETGATPVGAEDVFGLDVDVFAPCALGAVLNSETIPTLRARIVAGAANNQLECRAHGELLMREGILYAPDYVINAGGVIDVAFERTGYDLEKVVTKVNGIAVSLSEIFERSDAEQRPTSEVADDLARERFMIDMAA
ncbi:MAG: amino acid dehydrogenase [Gammaproteobacteria bacterium]|nr:Glu/Leu/Phe/Val dehydrogenase [Gammaproteobacteria bacterium]NIP90632.1 Glu/Leu/Phe/Val dehydrogenase [Gammaproteobacteria bacterium]NIR25255.1 Glu/Leu/Phe/Val dehydrogenase [Gammaproteobacteria bacterium]NIS06950.1 Glu/Leu/Phe/Val dehydrogenase [Gammaproteobacteria bacterium]NIU41920.1 amino acid dehydrogenase [Gammaproteobacteria bacterium]